MTRPRKNLSAPDGIARLTSSHRPPKEVADAIIQGLDHLVAQADAAGIGMASRILYTAKEELVHWAVTMNFHESAQDRFINRRLYTSSWSRIEALLGRALEDAKREKSTETTRRKLLPARK